MRTLEERVWRKIHKDGDNCWPWYGALNGNGYGTVGTGGKGYLAHRLVYTFTYGEIPEGLEVCHKCDNRRCCNPKHLFLGTHLDNMRDMVKKGRKVNYVVLDTVGEKNYHAKLTSDKVRQIRGFYQTGKYTMREIADAMGCTYQNVQLILSGKTWRHVK